LFNEDANQTILFPFKLQFLRFPLPSIDHSGPK
jgi:hypothetical protein